MEQHWWLPVEESVEGGRGQWWGHWMPYPYLFPLVLFANVRFPLISVPWTARRSNQSILKEIRPKYSLQGLMLKLKFQYCDHLMRRSDSLEKILMLGKIEDRRRKGWPRMSWSVGISDAMDMSLSKLQELVMDWEVWCAAVHGLTKSWTRLSDWTELSIIH